MHLFSHDNIVYRIGVVSDKYLHQHKTPAPFSSPPYSSICTSSCAVSSLPFVTKSVSLSASGAESRPLAKRLMSYE